MKFKVLFVSVFLIICLLPCISFSQNKVVVIPLLDDGANQVKTEYLALNGGQCTRSTNAPSLLINDFFRCDLTNSASGAEAHWPVPVPNGATLKGMMVHLDTSGGTTYCKLRHGTSNAGAEIAAVSDSTSGWHDTSEVTFTHTVNTSNQAYGVSCYNFTTSSSNKIGWIRIRYTY